jgi:ribose transport system substrate-binding protein
MTMCVAALRDRNTDKLRPFLPKHLMLDVEMVTPENAKEFYFPQSVY